MWLLVLGKGKNYKILQTIQAYIITDSMVEYLHLEQVVYNNTISFTYEYLAEEVLEGMKYVSI